MLLRITQNPYFAFTLSLLSANPKRFGCLKYVHVHLIYIFNFFC